MSLPEIRSHQIRRMGWSPDLPDHRDFLFAAHPTAGTLPASVDLRAYCSPVQDQLDLGSCTAHAIVGALEMLEKLHHQRLTRLSRLFVYYQERVIERTVKQDAGAQIRDGIKACAKLGVCREALCQYEPDKFARRPSVAAYTDAAKRTISSYQRVTSLRALKTALASKTPVVFGISVYDSFESEDVALHGIVPMPSPAEPMIGGHAIVAVGYDDATERVLCRNSWGPDWAIKGYFWLPYAYAESRDLSDDFWAVRQ